MIDPTMCHRPLSNAPSLHRIHRISGKQGGSFRVEEARGQDLCSTTHLQGLRCMMLLIANTARKSTVCQLIDLSQLTPNSQSNKAAEKAIADAITKATNSVDSELKTLKKHTVANTKEATAEVKVANTKEATAEAKMSTNIQHAIDQAITTNGTKIVNQQVKKASVPAPTVPPTASPEEVKLTKKMDAAVKAAVSNSSSEYA